MPNTRINRRAAATGRTLDRPTAVAAAVTPPRIMAEPDMRRRGVNP